MTYVIITLVAVLFLNIYCWQISQDIFEQNKQSSMLEKAILLANEIASQDILSSAVITQTLEKTGELWVTRLIVTDNKGLIIYDTSGLSPAPQYALLPQIIQALSGNDIFTCHYGSGVVSSAVAAPVMNYESVTGCVYMMENDYQSAQLLSSLRNNIFAITFAMELCVLIFSLIYALRFSGRLQKIMTSMRIIQNGDYSHKVRITGHDELSFLGREFNDLTDRLQTSETKRRQFVSDASHELKTPLASIKLLSDSILQYDMDLETVREFVTDISNEADRLNRMTLKLLALTKGEYDDSTDVKEIIYIAPTVERVVKMLSPIAHSNGIHIHTDLQTDSPVLVQEDDLYQIIYNLAENGIKYNIPNGELTISLRRNADNAILCFTDTGVGIPAEAISHIFERFYRVDKARSRQTGGSGLGLAIVRNMVQRNNGDIHVMSTPGQGTTFIVEFPSFETEVDGQ